MWQGAAKHLGTLETKETIWGTCAKPTLLARVSVTASNSSFNTRMQIYTSLLRLTYVKR